MEKYKLGKVIGLSAYGIVHKDTPYVIILLKVADEWAKTHGGSLPSTREEKKEFKELIRARMRAMDEDNYKEAVEVSFKAFAPRGISKFTLREDSSIQIMFHQDVVKGFLSSASGMLTDNGEVHVTHKTTYPFNLWEIDKLADEVQIYSG
ncbi:NEDD8-activating enzyme E1 regulatory subunit AXR1 [Camellia lanceoleosa]|uniref:NEDD8-activating enzyme E1 regulatory subunit AXR1 n=1 Tax=Camellia lanceoleosa TaxID=1840588 RepID=A0ACC0I3Q7_9ERIC|nr:NEDD8-activating enzyme E1 regulatory subunit AXR1 [Camellia lanceoleosa]